MNFISSYFNWLQKDTPTGTIEHYPELDEKKETSVKGIYVAGDLTGIPLLKLAAHGGDKLVLQFVDEDYFKRNRGSEDTYDVVIIGGGPAGVAAAVECKKQNLKYVLLETAKLFNTIDNFPKNKPILTRPNNIDPVVGFTIKDDIKESFLTKINQEIKDQKLNIKLNENVENIKRKSNVLITQTKHNSYRSLKVILAIGKSGNSRQLKIPGENLPKVFNRLFDPADYKNKDILVVGGGDSAIETSVSLAKTGNHITHSYRKDRFSRPKEENLFAFNELVKEKKITPIFNSKLIQIFDSNVSVEKNNKFSVNIKNDFVFTQIGKELPFEFFKKCKIKIEGTINYMWYIHLMTMVSFFSMLYFSKSGNAIDIFSKADNLSSAILLYLKTPFVLSLQWKISNYLWYSNLNFLIGWISSLIFIFSGTLSLISMFRNKKKYFSTPWTFSKYSYYIFTCFFFLWVYIKNNLNHQSGFATWVEDPTYWYSFFYCLTMTIFGIRRIYVQKTRYIFYQTSTLILIQIIFLFLLPFHLYEPFILGSLGENHWIIKEIFPTGKWSSFGLILFWPLNLWQFGTSTFWTIFSFFPNRDYSILYSVSIWKRSLLWLDM